MKDVSKLPKWAQEKIAGLLAQIEKSEADAKLWEGRFLELAKAMAEGLKTPQLFPPFPPPCPPLSPWL